MKKMLKEQAVAKLKEHNPNIVLIGEYVNLNTKTCFKCNVCDNVKYCSLQDVLNSSRKFGCLKCEKRSKNKKEKSRSKSHDQYVLDVYNVWNNSIEIIGQYECAANKVKTKCTICSHIWNPEAQALLKKHGCPKCGHEKNRNSTVKKHDEYVNEVIVKHRNNLSVIGRYISNNDRILIKCNTCQYEWLPTARNVTKGRGCPKCKLNKGETLINSILKELNANFKSQYVVENLKTSKNGVPIFDFAIFNENNELKAIIEYDGKQHYEEVKIWGGKERLIMQQEVDEFKNEYCVKNSIQLIRIKYNEFNKINTNYIKQLINGR